MWMLRAFQYCAQMWMGILALEHKGSKSRHLGTLYAVAPRPPGKLITIVAVPGVYVPSSQDTTELNWKGKAGLLGLRSLFTQGPTVMRVQDCHSF